MTASISKDRSGFFRSNIMMSAVLGVIAAALGYLLSALLIGGQARDAAMADVADWKIIAWYFYNGHMVDIEVRGSVGGFGGVDTTNLIAQSNAASAGLIYLVPPLVLLVIGGLLAYHLDARNLEEAVLAGSPVVLGYGIVLGAGAVVARSSAEATIFGIDVAGSIAPQLLPAIIVAGVIYPLVFATSGAIVVALIRST